MHNDEILTPVQGDGVFAASLPFFGGMFIWKANAVIIEKLPRSAPVRQQRDRAQLHALLAPQDADDLPRHHAVVRRHGRRQGADKADALRERRWRPSTHDVLPDWGKARLHAMIANRPDWCVSRQRNWGVPIPFFLHKESGELHPRTLELIEAGGPKRREGRGIEAWFSSTPPNCSATKRRSTTR
jgi:isoleucyl-tRNA synthetase